MAENNTVITGDNAPENGISEQGKQGSEKLFTQEDVNRIVQKRLNEVKDKANQNNAVSEKEIELNAKEQNILCREYVLNSDVLPAKLVDVIPTANFEEFKTIAEKIVEVFPEIKKGTHFEVRGANPANPPKNVAVMSAEDIAREAFKKPTY